MQIIYHPRAVKFLRKLPSTQSKKIIQKIDLLKTNQPINLNIKKLATTERTHRLRVGDIRVIYEKDEIGEIIYIHEIDFRGNIY